DLHSRPTRRSSDLHTCALLEGGDVLCWGQGGGTLGYGNFETIGDDEVPADVGPIQLGEPATDITGNCAILEGGRVKCWSATDGTLPYQAPEIEIGGPVLQLSQSTHFCALLPDHAIRCFGRNQNGCLGYGNTFSDCLSDCDDEPPECCVGYHGPPADAGNVPYE